MARPEFQGGLPAGDPVALSANSIRASAQPGRVSQCNKPTYRRPSPGSTIAYSYLNPGNTNQSDRNTRPELGVWPCEK